LKLFMTSSGAVRCSLPPLFGRFMFCRISLHKLYCSTRKWNVGPRGVNARRMFVFPVLLRLNSMRCVTPNGPAMVV
jgi:hypothetical protein